VIRVNLIATFRLAAGVRSFDLELPPGATVIDAVRRITERYPALRSHWLDSAGELHAHVHIFLNSTDTSTLPGGNLSPLPEGAVLDFIPPVAGGMH
jgi:molybdopterin synthase sulfur carrier subunit